MQKNERASKKQQELLSFVDGFIKGNGYGPSYREIMRALGYKSVSTVAIHIDGLIAKGYLARRDNSARSLEVVTTRVDIADTSAHNQEEQAIIERCSRISLTIDQQQLVVQALELLGYTKAVKTLKSRGADSENIDR